MVAKNLGLIRGTLKFVPGEILCGGEITSKPSELELLPDETNIFEINLSSSVSGPFVEDILFEITESGEKLKLTLK